MRIAPYWHRATHSGPQPHSSQPLTVKAFGWSFHSAEEAEAHAAERAKLVFERLALRVGGDERDRAKASEYYGSHPIREEVLQRHEFGGPEATLITRNRYGAEVLNSPCVFIADLDVPPRQPERPSGFFANLRALVLGSPPEPVEPDPQALEQTEQRVRTWCEQQPGRAARLYRTAAGFRLVATDALHEPTSDETAQALQELGSDPLYVQLTRHQACFRARLTAKPWRCQFRALTPSWPWESERHAAQAQAWIERYRRVAAAYQACELHTTLGEPPSDPVIQRTVALHDECCGVGNGSPLA